MTAIATAITTFTELTAITKNNPLILAVYQDDLGNYFLRNWSANRVAYLPKNWNSLPEWAQVFYLQSQKTTEGEVITLTFSKGTERVSFPVSDLDDLKVFYAGTERGLFVVANDHKFKYQSGRLVAFDGDIPNNYSEVVYQPEPSATTRIFGARSGVTKTSLKYLVSDCLNKQCLDYIESLRPLVPIQEISGAYEGMGREAGDRDFGYPVSVGTLLPISEKVASHFI